MEGIWLVAFVLQWIIVLLLVVLMVGVLRYLDFVRRNIHLVTRYASRFEEGDRINRFELSDLNGLPAVSDVLLSANSKTLLFFLNTGCSGCKAAVKLVADLAKREGGLKRFGWSFVFVYVGSRTSIKEHIAPLPLDEVTVLIDEKEVLPQRYDLRSFPVGIAVDNLGRVINQSGGPLSNWLSQVLNVSPPLRVSH